MDCERIALDIQSSIDGQLETERELELRAHLQECSHCRSLVDQMKAVGELVRGIPTPAPSEDLDRRVMASFLSSRAPNNLAPVLVRQPFGLWLSKPALAFIGALVLFFGFTAFYLGWTLGQFHPGNTPLVSPSAGIPTAPPSEESVRETEPSAQGSANLSWKGFQPILEPTIRIIGREAQ